MPGLSALGEQRHRLPRYSSPGSDKVRQSGLLSPRRDAGRCGSRSEWVTAGREAVHTGATSLNLEAQSGGLRASPRAVTAEERVSPRPNFQDVDENVVDVAHYWRVLRRHKTVLALGLVLGLALGIVAANLRSASYRSTASVVVQAVAVQNSTGALNSDAGVNIATQAEIASSPVVAERVREELVTDESAAQLLSNLTVTVPDRSNVLSFTYETTDAEAARARAQSFAESYLEVRRDQANQAVQELVDNQQERVDSVQEQLAETRAEIAASPANSAALRAAEVEEQVLLQQLASLQVQVNQVRSLVVEPGAVIAEATTPSSDGTVTAGAFLASFAFLGLLLATGYALLRSRSDKRVREVVDVEGRVGVPVVADLTADGSRGAEVLATKLLVDARRDGARTVVLAPAAALLSGGVAASPGIAAGVAASMARRGVRVLLVEATDGADSAALAGLRGNPHVRVVRMDTESAGTPGRVAELLASARDTADVVLVSAPPVLATTETLLIAAESDAVLLVAEQSTTRSDDLGAAVDDLEGFGARVLGVVLVDPSRSYAATGLTAVKPADRASGAPVVPVAGDDAVRAAAGRR